MEEEFRCRAINDYYASVADELDLREGCEYVIMQVSPSGWWYAVDENGEDGWVPSNYLVRIDDSGKEINEEDFDHQGDDGKSAEPVKPVEEVQAVEQPLPEEQEEETYVQKKSVTSQPQAPSHQGSVSGAKSTETKKTTTTATPATTTTTATATKTQEQKKPQEPTKTTTSTTTSTTTTKTTNPSANKSTTQKTNVQPLNLNVDDGAPDKPITEWTVDETLSYLQSGAKLEHRNDFKMTQACRYLTQLATDGEKCEDILSKGGIDIVFAVMLATQGDVAIQMSCCAACVVLCAHPACKQYAASTNGVFYLAQGIQDHMNYRPFVILAFNAVCNFCHDHPRHRVMALETEVVTQILKGMAYHRGKEEGSRVHSAGCLALRNIAADPKGQGAIGPDGVSTIVQGMEEYRSTKEVVEGSMGVLCNLCALAANGEAFVMQGGLQLLDNLYSDPDSPDTVRLAAASVLHNLAANQDTALLLSADQGIDLLVKILKKSDVDSVLFLNTLKVLTALLVKLPDDNLAGGNKKTEVILRILQRGLVASINEAVKYDNQELQEICATILVVMAQTAPKLAKAIADADAPSQLVHVGLHNPTAQTLHCVLAVFFHVSDDFSNQTRLVEEGIFKFLTSDWYKQPSTREDTVKLACGVFIKFFSNVRNAQAISEFEKEIQEFIDYNNQHRPSLKQLCVAMQNVLKQLDPMTSELHVQETYKKVENKKPDNKVETKKPENNKVDSNKEEEKQKEVVQDKGKNSKEVSKLGNVSSDVGQAVAQTRNSQTQAANPTSKTHSDSVASGGVPQVDKFYTMEEIKRNKSLASSDIKEAYLNDQEFEKVFGMSKVEFYNLRPWKQKQLKKTKGFF